MAAQTKWGIFFVASLFLLLMYRPPVGIMRQGFNISLHLGALLILAVFLAAKVNLWSGLLLGWAVASAILAALLYSDPAGERVICTQQSISALWAIMCGCTIYAVIVLTKPDDKWILNVLCIVLCLHVLCQLVQFMNGKPGVGIMFNPNDSSAFVALCSIAFLRPKWIYLSFIPIIGLILAKSFQGVLGLSFALIVFGWIHGNILFKFLPGALVCIGMILYGIFVDKPGTNRAEIWSFATIWTLENHWYTGCGPGNWKVFFAKFYSQGYLTDRSWVRIHNEWLEGFVEMGLPYVLLILGFLADNIRRFCKKATLPMTALGAIIGIGLASSFFKFNQLNGIVAIFFLALLEVKLRKGEEYAAA